VTRPRFAAVVSAIAASTVAFLVVSRWRLAGTITGAVLIPLIYTLVSHWSSQSFDHTAKWLRHRMLRGGPGDEPTRPSAAEALPSGTSRDGGQPSNWGITTKNAVPNRGTRRTQWLLMGFASLALAMSIYTLTSRNPVERVIVHDRVVEKITTVTTPAPTSGTRGSGASSSTTTTLAVAGGGTTSTAVTATSPGQTGEPTSTTIAPATTTTSPSLAPTTTAPPTTSTSLP
jgi:hypothetical protein